MLCWDLGALGLVSLCGGELAGDLLGGAVTGGLGKGLYSLVGASEAFSLATASHYKGGLKRKGRLGGNGIKLPEYVHTEGKN